MGITTPLVALAALASLSQEHRPTVVSGPIEVATSSLGQTLVLTTSVKTRGTADEIIVPERLSPAVLIWYVVSVGAEAKVLDRRERFQSTALLGERLRCVNSLHEEDRDERFRYASTCTFILRSDGALDPDAADDAVSGSTVKGKITLTAIHPAGQESAAVPLFLKIAITGRAAERIAEFQSTLPRSGARDLECSAVGTKQVSCGAVIDQRGNVSTQPVD